MGKLQAFATKISSGDMSTLVADLTDLANTLKATYAACIPSNGLRLVGDECSEDITKIAAAIPTVQKHLADKDYLSLIGDFSTIKGLVDDFSAHCVNQSADCKSKLATIESGVTTLLGHLKSFDQASIHTDASPLIDEIYGYKDNCIGLQSFGDVTAMVARITAQATPQMLYSLMMSNFVKSDVCQADIGTVIDQIPEVEAHLKATNVFGLLADYGKISGAITHFTGSCMQKSAECTTLEAALATAAVQFGKDFVAENKTAVHTEADAIIDQAFGWYAKCVKVPA